MRMLTLDEARSALKEAIAKLEEPGNAATLKAVIDGAAGDMAKLMMMVPATAVGMIAEVLRKYGFDATVPGVMMFVAAINMHRGSDAGIATDVATLQSKFMPSFQLPPAPK